MLAYYDSIYYIGTAEMEREISKIKNICNKKSSKILIKDKQNIYEDLAF